MRVLLISEANTVELTTEWQPVAATVYELAVVGGSPGPKFLDCTGRGRSHLGAPVARLRGPFVDIARLDPIGGQVNRESMLVLRPMEVRLGARVVSSLMEGAGLAGPWERRGEIYVRPWIVPPPQEDPPSKATGLYWWQSHNLVESVGAVVYREPGTEHGDDEEWGFETEVDGNNGRPSAERAQLSADRQLLRDGHLFVDSPDDVTLGEVF